MSRILKAVLFATVPFVAIGLSAASAEAGHWRHQNGYSYYYDDGYWHYYDDNGTWYRYDNDRWNYYRPWNRGYRYDRPRNYGGWGFGPRYYGPIFYGGIGRRGVSVQTPFFGFGIFR